MHTDHDVVVVGAGIAGLTAAYRLQQLDVRVLESAGEVGGRTYSERYDNGVWANFGAQYLSADKVAVLDLAVELEQKLIPVQFPEAELREPEKLSAQDRSAIDRAIKTLEAERARPRPPTAAELDDQTFIEFLAAEPPGVQAYFDHWCSSLMCVSSAETSLYGALVLWGDQRTAAFDNEPVVKSNLGDRVLEGGTHQLCLALAESSGAAISVDSRVRSIVARGGRFDVETLERDGERRYTARQVVCAVPAPVAAAVCESLPAWKHEALVSVSYGRFLSTPIVVAPSGVRFEPFAESWCRPRQVYNSNSFALRTPGDFETAGGCFHSYVYDSYARQIWDDPSHTVMTGAVRALLARFPQYRGRVQRVGYRRWRYGLPAYSPGRMKRQGALEASIDGLHFCGDYVLRSNTDGAVRSANLAAERVLARL